MLKFRFKKIKKIKNNFLKILAASLAVLNLFTNNFSLVNATENNISEKNSGNNTQKNIDKNNLVNNPKNVKNQFSQIKNIIKRTGFGIAASLAVYSIVKRYNKYTEDVRLIKEKENQEAAERLRKLKEDQEAEEARHLIKENQEEKLQQEMEETQILAEAQELFEDLETQNFRRKSMISGAGTNEEVMLNFIIFFLKAVCLAKEFLKILQRRLNFEHYESSKKITVIDTNANLDLNYLVPSELEPSAEDQWREFTREMLEKALGDLKQFFIFFAVILNVLVKTFKLNFFGGDKNGCERINRGYEPILIVTEYTCKSLESTSIMTENFGRKKVDDFKYILEKVYEKKTLDCLNNLEKILCNLKTNDNILVKNVVDILLFFYERSGFIIYNYW